MDSCSETNTSEDSCSEIKISKDARKQTLEVEDNEKRFKQPQAKLEPKTRVDISEPRRSTRAHNQAVTYSEEVDTDNPFIRKRSKLKSNSSQKSYISRPINEIRTSSDEERAQAIKGAEEIQNNLQSGHPSFVKSMVRSHVYKGFWLGLPSVFCKDHLPKKDLNMTLEDEDGVEFGAIYLGNRCGLSGGWRGFALDHKLDDGDALVFELTEPTHFKVYIFRAFKNISGDNNSNTTVKEEYHSCSRKKSKTKLEMGNGAQEKRASNSKKAGEIFENGEISHPKHAGKCGHKTSLKINGKDIPQNFLQEDVANGVEKSKKGEAFEDIDESVSLKLQDKCGHKRTGLEKAMAVGNDARVSPKEILRNDGFMKLPRKRANSEKLFRRKVY